MDKSKKLFISHSYNDMLTAYSDFSIVSLKNSELIEKELCKKRFEFVYSYLLSQGLVSLSNRVEVTQIKLESKRRVCTYIECGCDNKKTLVKLGGVTDSALRSTICYANSRLKTIVGENIILRISSGDKKAETIINCAYNRSKSDIIKGVSEKISSFWSGII